MLSEAYPEYGLHAPRAGSVLGASIHLHVDDCDALAAHAVDCGATLQMAPTDQFYGERSCRVLDPFGHQWMLGHEIEKVPGRSDAAPLRRDDGQGRVVSSHRARVRP